MASEHRYALEGKSWAWKQGWLRYERDPSVKDNPHELGTGKYADFEEGWNEAAFHAAVEAGAYDWDRVE